ncbi:phosphotransferase [Pseudomonas cerasi]
MILLLSGQYVDQDLRAEFGLIPPIFLPLGNKRLYHWISESLKKHNNEEEIWLTIPSDFIIDDWDSKYLDRLGINILKVERTFSLGQSVAFALSSVPLNERDSVIIYYGDTLIQEGVTGEHDTICIAKTEHNYIWLQLEDHGLSEHKQDDLANDDATIFCGVMSLTQPGAFLRDLIRENFSLIKALEKYNQTCNFEYNERHDWLDFGHVNTYYDSKSKFTTERAFNELKIDKNTVTKRSAKRNKLKAEYNWYHSIPEDLLHYTPRLISGIDNNDYYQYKIEYLFCPTLTELLVFGKQPKNVWNRIISSCFEFINKCSKHPGSSDTNFYDSLISKNFERLKEYLSLNEDLQKGFPYIDGVVYDLNHILEYCHSLISKESNVTLVHGDFCFSNILFDFKKNDIRVIDPRGIDFEDKISIYGDVRYDLAKILHSAIGKYDLIISDRFNVKNVDGFYSLEIPEDSIELESILKSKFSSYGHNYTEVVAITVTLFLSMLPLHYDRPDRQLAFIATAIKLYKELK